MPRWRHVPSAVAARALDLPMRWLGKGLLDLEVSGGEHVPRSGPVVIAANHLSHIDPPLVGNAAGRFVRFLALDELFGNHLVFDVVTGFFGAIPIDRDGAPVHALEEAVAHLERGGAVGVFPEGRRVEYWGETTPKRGAAWLAWMSGAPLVPVALLGTERTLGPVERGVHRTAVRIWIGPPIWWHEYAMFEDPLGAMTDAWSGFVDERLGPWWSPVRSVR